MQISLVEQFKHWERQGCCPALVNDDNGHWAISFNGMSPVFDSDEPRDMDIVTFVDKAEWQNTIEEALAYAVAHYKE